MTLEEAKAILANAANNQATLEDKKRIIKAAKVVAGNALKPPASQG